MSKPRYMPGGYESDTDNDELYLSDYDDHSRSSRSKVTRSVDVKKTPLELKKEALLTALKENQLDTIKKELNQRSEGFDIDDKLDEKWNLLYHACNLGRSEILKFLIEERGVDPNIMDGDDSAFLVACSSQADSSEVIQVVNVLMDNNVNFRASNNYGVTPMMSACAKGHIEVVKCLILTNDSFDAIDNEGRNALFYAIDGKQVEIARILIEAGIDLSVVNMFGESAKRYAGNDNNLKILELFPPEIQHYQPPSNFLSYNRFKDLIPELTTDM